jgi:NAD(P)-dependent dehydrogenase (short-subunit alcohol dehydrogenase family)
MRNVLITGAANGLGAACVDAFLADGWNVYGWDRAPGLLAGVEWAEIDTTDWEGVHAAATALPPLQAVLNCAGIGSREPAVELSREEWDRVVAINLSGCFYVAHAVHPRLAAGGGTLVNFSSITATRGYKNRSVYSATKAALLGLTRCLAVEWADDGIRVIAISPAYTMTPMFEQGIREGKTSLANVLAGSAQHRVLETPEIGIAVLRLVSDDFRCVTGSEIMLDGGTRAYAGY